MVESLYKLNEFNNAKVFNNVLLEQYPQCIPGMVYQVLLETDNSRKTRLKELLLVNHGDHWLVKQKLL